MSMISAALVAVLSLSLMSGPTVAQELPANVVTFTPAVATDYVTPIGIHTGRTSFQGDAMYSRFFGQRGQNRWYAGLWGAMGANFGDEYDTYVGVFYDTGVGLLNAEILTYNIEPVGFDLSPGDAYELGIRHNWRLSDRWTAGIGARFVTVKELPVRSAPILYAECEWTCPVAARTEVSVRQRLGHDFGVYGFAQDDLSNTRLTLSHAFDSYGASKLSGYLDGSGTINGDAPRGYYVSAGLAFSQSFGF